MKTFFIFKSRSKSLTWSCLKYCVVHMNQSSCLKHLTNSSLLRSSEVKIINLKSSYHKLSNDVSTMFQFFLDWFLKTFYFISFLKNLDQNFGEFSSRFVVNCYPVSDLGVLLKMKKNFHLHMALKFFWDRILKNGARRSEYMYKTLLSSKGLVWNLIERAKVLQTSYLAIPPPKSRGFGITYFSCENFEFPIKVPRTKNLKIFYDNFSKVL